MAGYIRFYLLTYLLAKFRSHDRGGWLHTSFITWKSQKTENNTQTDTATQGTRDVVVWSTDVYKYSSGYRTGHGC